MINGPIEFDMGSPPTEPERFESELLHIRVDSLPLCHCRLGSDGQAISSVP